MPTTDSMETGPEHRLQATNLTLLTSALRALRATCVEVTYAGARGHCHAGEVSAIPADALTELHDCRVVQYRLATESGQRPIAQISETVRLTDALKHFTLHWASLQHGYWQRGDGGRGVMRIEVASGQLTLDHDAFVVEHYHARLSE